MNSLNRISNEILSIIAIVLVIIISVTSLKQDLQLKSKSYDYLELKHSYKNYRIVKKECINDTCYYLRLRNPIDSTMKDEQIKVKDYIFFNWFVGDYIK